MLDEKTILNIKKRVAQLINEGIIIKGREKRFVQFFLDNSKDSLNAAGLLFEVSTDNGLKDATGYPDFNGFLWVINASYYSMFYMARALLENEGIRIRTEESIHAITFDAIVHYFYITGKLQKKIIEEYAEGAGEASEILGKEKSKELIEDYFYEKNKRARFTYEIGTIAMQNKAETSLKRAKRFNEEIRKMIEMVK